MSCYISQSLPSLLIHYLDTTLSYSFCHLFYAKLFFAQQTWDPISPQQRHGASIVEVYRIIEETADQFFAFKVPMRTGELNSLCRGFDKAFQVYTQLVTGPIGLHGTLFL
jgi:hypothetical protein